MFDGVDKYFPALACPTSPEKPGKPNKNLPMVNLILKILKYDIKSWKHCQNLGRKEDFEKKIFVCQKMPKMAKNGKKKFRISPQNGHF